ncbi:unnamed protein product [Rhizophagus irregularis]|nr:unnamed protein product [Rhizophagus irregularis]
MSIRTYQKHRQEDNVDRLQTHLSSVTVRDMVVSQVLPVSPVDGVEDTLAALEGRREEYGESSELKVKAQFINLRITNIVILDF